MTQSLSILIVKIWENVAGLGSSSPLLCDVMRLESQVYAIRQMWLQ